MFQHVFRKRFLQHVNKLWADSDLASAKDVVWEYLTNQTGLESVSIDARKFGLYIRISRETRVGSVFIHASVSIPDFETLIIKMREFDCSSVRSYMEEVIQACFGYDTLLIEKSFLSSPIKIDLTKPITAKDLPSSPDSYVYHWIYEDIDKKQTLC